MEIKQRAKMLITRIMTVVVIIVSGVHIGALVSAGGAGVAPPPTPASGNNNYGENGNGNNNNDFCTRATTVRTCPSPPTIDTLDLRTLMGTYYEVGSTAPYKLRNELGMTCSRTNFSVDNPAAEFYAGNTSTATAGAVINVENSGVPVLVGRRSTLSALSRIALSAAGVCRTAARMCSASKLSEAMLRISAVSDQIPGASDAAATLPLAASAIDASIAGVHARLNTLSRAINSVALISGEISQASGPVSPLIRSLRSTVVGAAQEISELGTVAIGNLTYARSMIRDAAPQMPDASAGELLSQAAQLVHDEMEVLTDQVMRVQEVLSSIEGPLADMIEADRENPAPLLFGGAVGDNDDMGGGSDVDPSDGPLSRSLQRVIMTRGQAIQLNPAQRGNLALKLTSSPSNAMQPYKVIAVQGAAGMEYSSILIYSCSPETDGSPLPELLLLSRTPTLPAQTVFRLIDVASKHGIYTDCHAAFVPTHQGSSDQQMDICSAT